jgi:hypothetical protein
MNQLLILPRLQPGVGVRSWYAKPFQWFSQNCVNSERFGREEEKPLKRFPSFPGNANPKLKLGENEKLIFYPASAVAGI